MVWTLLSPSTLKVSFTVFSLLLGQSGDKISLDKKYYWTIDFICSDQNGKATADWELQVHSKVMTELHQLSCLMHSTDRVNSQSLPCNFKGWIIGFESSEVCFNVRLRN